MKVAVPSKAPGGLAAGVEEHFGHCAAFTLVEVDGEALGTVEVVANQHAQGGCMDTVNRLQQAGAEALVVGGMGRRPLLGFQQVGIPVYHSGGARTVEEAVLLLAAGQARPFGDDLVCAGGPGHGHGPGGGPGAGPGGGMPH
jgi:predicted Fe-Mo cluster-binding NifX family protein